MNYVNSSNLLVAGAISCGLYYAGKGAITGAITNVAVQSAKEALGY